MARGFCKRVSRTARRAISGSGTFIIDRAVKAGEHTLVSVQGLLSRIMGSSRLSALLGVLGREVRARRTSTVITFMRLVCRFANKSGGLSQTVMLLTGYGVSRVTTLPIQVGTIIGSFRGR